MTYIPGHEQTDPSRITLACPDCGTRAWRRVNGDTIVNSTNRQCDNCGRIYFTDLRYEKDEDIMARPKEMPVIKGAMTLQELFKIGMKRDILDLLPNFGKQIDLGGGNNPVPGTEAIDITDGQDFNAEPTLLYDDDSIDVIHAYHLLEHLDTPVHLLQECQRVLKVGGHMNIVVPYYSSQLQASCWEHKSFFSEESWEQTFCKNCNKFGYDWYFHVHFNVIMGVVEKNMCLMTQLIKMPMKRVHVGYTK